MKRFPLLLLRAFALVVVLVALVPSQQATATLPPSESCTPEAPTCIPGGAEINSATLFIYSYYTNIASQDVGVHRVTSPWAENGVTWSNFGESFDAALEGSFAVNAPGWSSVDVTELVKSWIDGSVPNYGFLLEQDAVGHTEYRSSEYTFNPCLRPKLEICYTTPGDPKTCIRIQRPGLQQEVVADAHIWAAAPEHNNGTSPTLYTGLYNGYDKPTLIRFDICTLPCTGSIGNFVWHDLNRNGIQDAGEPGIEAVTVTLTDDTGGVKSTITGVNGYYQFPNLCAGTYTVAVDESTLPSGFTATPDYAQGSTPEDDSNSNPEVVTLPTDDSSDQTIDFGFLTPCEGKIGDLVWHDMNQNGIQDAGEPGLSGVTVNLNDAFGGFIVTTTTGSNGYYQFPGRCAGAYTVYVDTTTLPQGFVPSICNASTDDAVDNDCSPASVILESDNESDQTIDFGYFVPAVIGTGTPGYWMNHPDAWPVEMITIGGVVYDKSSAISLMKLPTAKDKTYSIFQALVASKLNVMGGNEASCISDTITVADAWMMSYPAGSGVKAAASQWKQVETMYRALDDYNNGLLCAASRDLVE